MLCKALPSCTRMISSIWILSLVGAIKRDNIFFSQTKKYKLGDVGLTRLKLLLGKGTLEEKNMKYVAPELLVPEEETESKSMNDLKKADIYSLGLSILELMVGKPQVT